MDFTALKARLANYPEILAAYVFGVAASGRLAPMSDLDVALLLDEDGDLNRRLLLICNIASGIPNIHHKRVGMQLLISFHRQT